MQDPLEKVNFLTGQGRSTARKTKIQAYKRWNNKWKESVPEAVKCLEEDIEDLLTFYELPKAYWKKLRTTNPIERQFREVRRRTRPMSCFQNRNSVERIIFAIFHRQNRIWEN
jgi:transposase-like protein